MLSVISNFSHGMIVIPMAYACIQKGLFDHISPHESLSFEMLSSKLGANSGHLRVAISSFESLGWLDVDEHLNLSRGPRFDEIESIPQNLDSLLSFPFHRLGNGQMLGGEESALLAEWISLAAKNWGGLNHNLREYLDGVLFGPTLIEIKSAHKQVKNLSQVLQLEELPEENRALLKSLFLERGWLEGGETLSDTPSGRFIFDRIYNGATVYSYRPMMLKIDEILFGDCGFIFKRDEHGNEQHIDRTLNVLGSGFQHKKFFGDLLSRIGDIFDHEPLTDQPQYLVDMGCGDGTLLKEAISYIKCSTLRGRKLAEFPLKLVGADFNEKALEQTRLTLEGEDFIAIKGDICDPEKLMEDLVRYGAHRDDILHIRSFLDHDRPISPLDGDIRRNLLDDHQQFAVGQDGGLIDSKTMTDMLTAHLERWSKVLGKHGLLLLEVHCLDPKQISQAPERSESLHFDAYHRLSHQFLNHAESFLMAAASAQLFTSRANTTKYPKTLPFSRITLNCFKKRLYRIRYASHEDLSFLEKIENDLEPALRCDRATLSFRLARYPSGQLVVEMEGKVVAACYTQRVNSINDVLNSDANAAEMLHKPHGSFVQLLALKVLPDFQSMRLGHDLLDFVLLKAFLTDDVEHVIGVSRCRDYGRHSSTEFEEYIGTRDSSGRLCDATLRFHEGHGAKIVGPVSDFRPWDEDHRGFGVLVHYNLYHQKEGSWSIEQNRRTEGPRNLISTRDFLIDTLKKLLSFDGSEEIDLDRPFMEMGLDSADMVELNEQVSKKVQLSLEPAFFFEFNTARKVQAYLEAESQERNIEVERPEVADSHSVAIVGVSCRLPGGIELLSDLWSALIEGKEVIGSLTDRFQWPEGIDPRESHPGMDRAGLLDNIRKFDADHFRISPREAALMDPQQRMLLEGCWHCFEDAGYAIDDFKASLTGVFIGASGSDYRKLLAEEKVSGAFHVEAGSSMSALANRISYFFDLLGPSIQIDTACSSSLMAVHQAVTAIKTGQCRQALAAGIHVICQPDNSIAYHKAGMLAQDGRCKVFDKQADGFVRSEGYGVILIKSLQAALDDGDHIYARIEGSATNHGGLAGGLTVPNPGQQASLYRAAWKDACVDPSQVSYIETHGTGTSLGDPIEIRGLREAFSHEDSSNVPAESCALGALKSHLGHLEAAAGIAGLLKAVLCLNHRKLPGLPHLNEMNPQINLETTPFYINKTSKDWLPAHGDRYCGVSSFGSGGSNVHVVLRESPSDSHQFESKEQQQLVLVTMSARTPERLIEYASLMSCFLRDGSKKRLSLYDIARNLCRRTRLKERVAFIVSTKEDLLRACDKVSKDRISHRVLSMIPTGLEDKGSSLGKMAQLWIEGGQVDWDRMFSQKAVKVDLPRYPFAETEYWFRPKISCEDMRPKAQGSASAKPNQIRLRPLGKVFSEASMEPKNLDDSKPTRSKGEGGALRKKDVLEDLKSAMTGQVEGMVPTLNRTGYMIEKLISYSEAFAKFAGSCQEEVLDIGCAYGIASIAALEQGAQVLAMDMEEQHLGILRRRISDHFRPNLRTQAAQLPHVDYEDESFGAVHAARIFHFLPPNDYRVSLAKIFRWLVPGGKLFLISDTPYVGLWRTKAQEYLERKAQGELWPGHISDVAGQIHTEEAKRAPSQVNPVDAEILERECARAGFIVEKIGYEGSDIFPDAKGTQYAGREHVGIIARKPLLEDEPRQSGERSETTLDGSPLLNQVSDHSSSSMSMTDVIGELKKSLSLELEKSCDEIHEDTPFIDLGVDSIIGVTWVVKINSKFGLSLKATEIYDHPTLKDFARLVVSDASDGWHAHEKPAPIVSAVATDQGIQKDPASYATNEAEVLSVQWDRSGIQEILKKSLSQELQKDIDLISGDTLFSDMGVDSIIGVTWIANLNAEFGLSIKATQIYSYPTIQEFASYIMTQLPHSGLGSNEDKPVDTVLEPVYNNDPHRPMGKPQENVEIAIVGAAGRFPKSPDLDAFWENIVQGVDCVSEVSSSRWWKEELFSDQIGDAGKTTSRWMGELEGVDEFDAFFFNISPREAEMMDPQQRLFLQSCWHCLEDAGYPSNRLSGTKCGVFIGCAPNDYLNDEALNTQGLLGGASSILAARISYFLNLGGPCLAIDTACSSSLVAIATACDSLALGHSDVAFAGGVSVIPGPATHIMASHAGVLSPDGRCHTFDTAANGFVASEGVGVVLLKRLEDAKRDGDSIQGVIRGWGVNQDGKTNGMTAPSSKSQTRLITEVYQQHGIDSTEIQLVEAHGTGTKLGDPIEVEALKSAFKNTRKKTLEDRSCALGSVKSNIGHSLTAAGVSGLLKLLLAIKHKKLPPTIHYHHLNPHITLNDSPFYINDTARDWSDEAGVRQAAVSSFGFSGTNAHVVLAEYPAPQPTPLPCSTVSEEAILLSAKSKTSLLQKVTQMLELLNQNRSDLDLRRLSYSLVATRDVMKHRIGLVTSSLEDLVDQLEGYLSGITIKGVYVTSDDQARASLSNLIDESDFADLKKKWFGQRKLEPLVKIWVEGESIPWQEFYDHEKPQKMKLPLYPFDRSSYWVPTAAQKSLPEGVDHEKEQLFTLWPRWQPLDSPLGHRSMGVDRTLVIGARNDQEALFRGYLGQNADFCTIEEIPHLGDRLSGSHEIHVIWLIDHCPEPRGGKTQTELDPLIHSFRLAKELDQYPVSLWTIITQDAYSLSGQEESRARIACVHAFFASISKESSWKVRLFDVPSSSEWPYEDVLSDVETVVSDVGLFRHGQWFQRQLLNLKGIATQEGVFKNQGIYVIVGGGGGLGQMLTQKILQENHAKIYWLGRRSLDDELRRCMSKMNASGLGSVDYLQVDGRDRNSLRRAFEQIRLREGSVTGVIHAAVAEFDSAFEATTEPEFVNIVRTKIEIAANLIDVLQEDHLDFILLFSSFASFVTAPGMAGYTAGCAYKDGLAHQRDGYPWPIKVVNWGFWDCGTGKNISPASLRRLKQQGMVSIEVEEGYRALKQLLASSYSQCVVIKTSRPEAIDQLAEIKLLCHADGSAYVSLASLDSDYKISSSLEGDLRCLSGYLNHDLEGAIYRLLYRLIHHEIRSDSIACDQYKHWVAQSAAMIPEKYASGDSIDVLWEELNRVVQVNMVPGNGAILELILVCLKNLPEILLGRKSATSVIFPESSISLVEGIYKGNPLADLYNNLLADVLKSYLSKVSGSPKGLIRILEIGAGTGGSTERILQEFEPYKHLIQEYCYTDLSIAFLNGAEIKYGQKRPFMSFGRLDIEKDPADQGFEVGCYDIVIGSNVLHATRDMRATLNNAKKLLKHQGILALNEISELTLFAHLTFGLLEGWWLAEDKTLRIEGSPGLNPAMWRALLHEEGFQTVMQPLEESHRFGQQIILAESDGYCIEKCDDRGEIKPSTKDVDMAAFAPDVDRMIDPEERMRLSCIDYFTGLLSRTLRIDASQIQLDEELEHYGIDSILIVQMTREMEDLFGEISTTVFFEVRTLRGLVDYFITNHRTALEMLEQSFLEKSKSAEAAMKDSKTENPKRSFTTSFTSMGSSSSDSQGKDPSEMSIAIIGISGRYPEADSLPEFWSQLKNGYHGIKEIPSERWELDGFYDPDPGRAVDTGKSYSKWGGFIKDPWEFDPLFFKMAPKDVLAMDPQERLFIQSVWHTLEDAGYTKAALADTCQSKVGVFAGITRTGFDLYGPKLWKAGHTLIPHTSFSSVANRISFLLNLNGPSLAIDTMCSSSLTALHEACVHIRAGECRMAIAGGVNLYLHPSSYVDLSAHRMLSKDGVCRSFGSGGDGFVPGEGVGSVLLKPLAEAIADHDNIHAIIRSSSVNHGGKTNGYTVPNPLAQAELIKETLEKAQIDPSDVSYVEAHGTGTELGDPIEISGLTKAYGQASSVYGPCSIGSVKSNIGHLEAAAGIAGLTKVILQLKHKKLVPSLHADRLNEKIRFSQTPFRMQTELAPWDRSRKVAGLSSFGAGGSNAHFIIESYERPLDDITEFNLSATHEWMIPFSAKTEEALREQVRRFSDYIQDLPESEASRDSLMRDIAYTLCVGREAMPFRTGFGASHVFQLQENITRFLEQGDRTHIDPTLSDHTRQRLQRWLDKGEMQWIDSNVFRTPPMKISLPLYPFAKEVYWFNQLESSFDAIETDDFDEESHDKLLDRVLERSISVKEAIKTLH